MIIAVAYSNLFFFFSAKCKTHAVDFHLRSFIKLKQIKSMYIMLSGLDNLDNTTIGVTWYAEVGIHQFILTWGPQLQ